ncbi:MAG: hypothetical protein OXE99_06140 [Cellvibrionales bacterium]|nr:hypothetical protein [Cellvibrionales bacterium]
MNPQASTHLAKQFNQLAIAIIGKAKTSLPDSEFEQIAIKRIPPLVPLLAESIAIEHLLDPLMLQHTIEGLVKHESQETLLMRLFTLSIFKYYSEGSQHPLEKGIIRQKILSILPYFEKAANQGKIPLAVYDKNADALAHFADDTDTVNALLIALKKELERPSKHLAEA